MKDTTSQSLNQDVQKLGELLKDHKFAMLTSIDEDGSLHARPMGTLEVDFDGRLWFFTQQHSPKVAEIKDDAHVNVSYAKPDKNQYVSVRGVARLVKDREKMAELFKPIHKAWFPEGLNDPELALLEVEVYRADFWDSPSSKVVQMVGFAKALLTGEAYKPGPGETGQINLR